MVTTYLPNGSLTVTVQSTGVPVPLATAQFLPVAYRVDIQALRANGANVIVGGSGITQDLANGGMDMAAGDVYNVELIKDLSSIFVVGNAGDGVTINWWVGDRV